MAERAVRVLACWAPEVLAREVLLTPEALAGALEQLAAREALALAVAEAPRVLGARQRAAPEEAKVVRRARARLMPETLRDPGTVGVLRAPVPAW